jgi:hypothetical protein
MKNIMNIGKATSSMLLNMDRAISRELEIQSGMRINHHHVHVSKKTYNRKDKHKSVIA